MKNKTTKSIAAFHFEIKSISEDGTFEGYGAIFGNVDFGGDVIEPGAFADTIKAIEASGRKLVILWQHYPDQPIGVYTEIKEDAKGLYVKGQLLLEVQAAREAYALLKGGAISGLSIGYGVVISERNDETGVRTLKQLDLYEVSLVTFPMNDVARVAAVKNRIAEGEIPTEREFEKFLRDAGFSKKNAAIIASSGIKGLLRDAKEHEAHDEKENVRGILDALKSFTIPTIATMEK